MYIDSSIRLLLIDEYTIVSKVRQPLRLLQGQKCIIVLFELMLYVPVNTFSVMLRHVFWVEPVLSYEDKTAP